MMKSTVIFALMASASAFTVPVSPTQRTASNIRLFESSPAPSTETETSDKVEVPPTEEAASQVVVAAAAEEEEATITPPKPEVKKPAPKKKPAAGGHKEGVFSPAVLFVRELMGDQEFLKLRGKVISLHSDVIGSFVDTSESVFGDAVLRALFRLADKDNNGTLCKEELKSAVQSLGFTWLEDKQVEGIFAKADADGNGSIDIDEWVEAAPLTLRRNLIKLAKKNGNDMGLLA